MRKICARVGSLLLTLSLILTLLPVSALAADGVTVRKWRQLYVA